MLVSNTPDELVRAAATAIHQPEELAEMAEAGRQRVLARYSWDLLAERLNDVWTTVARVPALTAV